ncbi:hypothetical protein [Gluconacetobacter asukensis]|uniref:Uncharacterized protein n=1 Tax=Gluconacetobacter asukensis TaxID=1017181 RepID=A0A7W4IZI8_9PROT|nr:hypothetical protein [Gluconacetobacter asukensis]MBB2171758.1 hypothetical protein [Gluconacetobacter asukensis]
MRAGGDPARVSCAPMLTAIEAALAHQPTFPDRFCFCVLAGSLFFFEKKNQKTSDLFRSFLPARCEAPERIKSLFASFSSEKEESLLYWW